MATKGQKFKKWTEDEKNQIFNLRKSGYLIKEIAQKMNTTTGTIGTILINKITLNNIKTPNYENIYQLIINITNWQNEELKKQNIKLNEEIKLVKKFLASLGIK